MGMTVPCCNTAACGLGSGFPGANLSAVWSNRSYGPAVWSRFAGGASGWTSAGDKVEPVIIKANYTKCIILNDTFRIIIMIYTNRISPLAPLYRRSDSAPEEDTIAGAPPCPSLFGAEGRDQDFALPIAGFIRSHLTCKKKSVTIDRLARRANHSVEMMGWIRHRLKCLTLSSLFYLEGGEYEWTF